MGSLYRNLGVAEKGREAQELNMRPVKRMVANQVTIVGIEARLPKKGKTVNTI